VRRAPGDPEPPCFRRNEVAGTDGVSARAI
jgi:hypothetical protein